MTRTLSSIVFAVFLITSLVAGVASVQAQENPVTTLDKDHSLDCSEEVTKQSFSAPNLEVRIGDTGDQVGLDGFSIDSGGTYLKFDYQEERSRTIRIHLPEECFRPYEGELEPKEGENPAELDVIEDGSYTSVTVEFDGEGTAIYKTSSVKGIGFESWERIKDPFSSDGVPGTDEESETDNETVEEWQYIDAEEIASQDQYEIQTSKEDTLVQYNAAGDGEDADWVRVPSSSDTESPLYIHTREDVDDKIWVMQTSEETSQVRYKTETRGDIFTEASEGVKDIVDGIREDLSDIDLIPFI